MRATSNHSLTQDELVAELRRSGYADVTVRRVAAWRGNDLLPPFDRIGSGLGQHKGRERNSWSDRDTVVNQALWICDLLPHNRSLDDLHVPLWMLGYTVPAERVRRALREPLDSMIEAIKAEITSSGELEDVIGDTAYQGIKEMGRAGARLFQVPQEVMEAFLNLIFNEDYDLSDAPFEDGVAKLEEFERDTHDRYSATLAARGIELYETRSESGLGDFFKHAPLIKECLSVPRLKRALDESTEEDWLAVERDVGLLREMAVVISRLFGILLRDLDEKYKEPTGDALRPIFSVGKLLIWVDLSLRRCGYSEMVEFVLSTAAQAVREKCDEKLERELAEISPALASAFNTTADMIVEDFSTGKDAAGRN